MRTLLQVTVRHAAGTHALPRQRPVMGAFVQPNYACEQSVRVKPPATKREPRYRARCISSGGSICPCSSSRARPLASRESIVGHSIGPSESFAPWSGQFLLPRAVRARLPANIDATIPQCEGNGRWSTLGARSSNSNVAPLVDGCRSTVRQRHRNRSVWRARSPGPQSGSRPYIHLTNPARRVEWGCPLARRKRLFKQSSTYSCSSYVDLERSRQHVEAGRT